jgi:succinate-semialdehyde dehydrogenase/glutarate-semialdehyde dehydrogenase
MLSKFRNMGQTCVCANRLFVQDKVYDAFAAKLAAAAAAMKVGDGLADGVTQGPLINMEAIEKVEGLVNDAVRKGAKVLTGGKRHALGQTFFEPTVLTDVNTQMPIAQEEIFGPVATLFRFSTEADAIRLANDTEYGLAAYFYARDLGRVWRVAEALEYGIVGINDFGRKGGNATRITTIPAGVTTARGGGHRTTYTTRCVALADFGGTRRFFGCSLVHARRYWW